MARVRDATPVGEASGLAERLLPFLDLSRAAGVEAARAGEHHQASDQATDELVERAATLLAVMPPRPRRDAFERLVCPTEPERGRRAVGELLERGLAVEDDRGCLRALP